MSKFPMPKGHNISPSLDISGLRWKRTDWLIVFALAGLVLLFHWRLLTPNLADRQSYLPGDFSYQFWAFSTFEARELSAGRLPLWNPYAYGGSPFWADVQSAVFYPFSLLTLLLSGLTEQGFSLFALELEAIFHFWLGGLFMYLFARRITQSRLGGAVGALIFTFGGYLTGYPSQQLAVLEVDVWLLLILFFIDRALLHRQPGKGAEARQKPAWAAILFAGVAWGMALLAGHPQSWMLVGYTFVAYFLFVLIFVKNPSPPSGGRTDQSPSQREGLGEGEISALNQDKSAQSTLTGRKTPTPSHPSPSKGGGFKKPLSLLLIIITGFALSAIQLLPAVEYTRLSVRAEGIYDNMAGGFPLTDPIQILLPGVVSLYSPLYVGVVGLLLAILALFWIRNRFTTFWGVWGGLAFLISFGGNTFLYAPLYWLAPGFSIFRGQERWAFVLAFSLAVLAAYGARALAPTLPHKMGEGAFQQLVGWLALGALGLVVIFFYGLNANGWSAESQFYQLLNQAVWLFILLALSWALLRAGDKLPKIWFGLALCSLIALDLFSVNWQSNLYPQPPEWHTQKPTVVEAIQTDSALSSNNTPVRVYNEFRLYDNYGIPFEVQDLWGASPLRLSRYNAFLAPPMLIERAWEMLNVKYVISWREELYAPSTIIYQEPAPDGATYVHRLETVGPRAWLAHTVEEVSENEMIPRLANPAFDFSETALIAPDHTYNWRVNSLPDGAKDDVQIISFSPNELVLHVNAAAAGLLVLSEIAYPGWQAEIDGQPVEIETVNYILRGLPVSAGEHTAVLTFEPLGFKVGAVISLLALSAFIIFVIGMLFSRRKKENGSL